MSSFFFARESAEAQRASEATAWRVVYCAVGRDRAVVAEHCDPCVDEAITLGRHVVERSDPPGWDDVRRGRYRAIKLPVHDLGGTTSFVVGFGASFPEAQAQMFCEKLALMLLPLIAPDTEDGGDDNPVAPPSGAAAFAHHAPMLESVLAREVETINSRGRVWQVENQVAEVRAMMERNVEMMLEREERLERLEAQSAALKDATKIFRSGARKLKRWHLMNQVKWGVAIGTCVTLSVAIPIAVLAAA